MGFTFLLWGYATSELAQAHLCYTLQQRDFDVFRRLFQYLYYFNLLVQSDSSA